VYFHPRADPFTGVQRMTCLVLLVVTVLATGALFFGQNDYASQEIMVAIIMSIVAAASTGLFSFLFSRAGKLHPAAQHQLDMETRPELQFRVQDFIDDTEMQVGQVNKEAALDTAEADTPGPAQSRSYAQLKDRASHAGSVSASSPRSQQSVSPLAETELSKYPSMGSAAVEPASFSQGTYVAMPGVVASESLGDNRSTGFSDVSATLPPQLAPTAMSALPTLAAGEVYMSAMEPQSPQTMDAKPVSASALDESTKDWAFVKASPRSSAAKYEVPAEAVDVVGATRSRKAGSSKVVPITVSNARASSSAVPAAGSPSAGRRLSVMDRVLRRKSDVEVSPDTQSKKYGLNTIRNVVANTAASAGLSGEMDLKAAERRFRQEEKIRKSRTAKRFPQWVLIATWIAALLWIGGCTWLILVYGLKFDRESVSDEDTKGLADSAINPSWPISTRWLMTALFATIQDWAVNKPFSVFLSTLVSLVVGEAAALGLEFCVENTGCW